MAACHREQYLKDSLNASFSESLVGSIGLNPELQIEIAYQSSCTD